MNEHTYKIIELIGSSKTSLEQAVENALSRASESLRNCRWFEIEQIRGIMENEKIVRWQVTVKVAFAVEDTLGAPEETGKAEPSEGEKSAGKYRCKVCGYIYDPAKGDPRRNIKPGTPFEKLPDDWTCPECGVNKDQFTSVQ